MSMSLGLRITAIGSLLGLAMGCSGVAGDEEYLGSEQIGVSQQALGSSKRRVDIASWNGLTGMLSDGHYRLTADIYAAGKTWTPKDFSGTFDGNGKTIYDLTINVSGDAGFFHYLNQAIVRNVKFVRLNVTGSWMVGGLASLMQDSLVEYVAIEGTVTANQAFAAGGIFGEMFGGSVFRSYAKGNVNAAWSYSGGLAGFVAGTSNLATITESWAQVTVAPDTSDANRWAYAGGIAGYGTGVDIHDVYAVGNVTGRNGVGGIVGVLGCQDYLSFLVHRAIYRGDVVDRNAPNGGWAGVFGTVGNCSTRVAHLWYDREADPSSNWHIYNARATTPELRSPTTANGGIFCSMPANCANDANFDALVWDAGTNSQHHAIKNLPAWFSDQPR